MSIDISVCRKMQGQAEPGNSCLQTPGTCESCPLWNTAFKPITWDQYRSEVIAYAKVKGFIDAAKATGIGKTTLYRWRKELK